jgi:hypothetical protein
MEKSFNQFLIDQVPESADEDSYYYGGDWNAMYSAITEYREGIYELQYFGSYQGDFGVIIVAGDGTVCVTIGGYGSCSYCDAAQRCKTPAEFRSLISDTYDGLEWFTLDEWVAKYAAIKEGKTEENRWYYHDNEVVDWVVAKLATLDTRKVRKSLKKLAK